tara:strand:+ start:358 stop:549 length:192 start_codon:yes stop_codon:yes gene_type:complete
MKKLIILSVIVIIALAITAEEIITVQPTIPQVTQSYTHPTYVTEGCHPALTQNMTYYEICPED